MLKSSLAERDNPFRPGGTLDREAVEMIRSSTFSRSTVIIKDPAASRANSLVETDDGPVRPHKAVLVHFQSPIKSSPHVPPRRNCSREDDDDDDDEDDEDDYEEEEGANNGLVGPESAAVLGVTDNNNHFHLKASPARQNGKAGRNGVEEGEVVAAATGPHSSQAPAQVEHVRLTAKRRKCCAIM